MNFWMNSLHIYFFSLVIQTEWRTKKKIIYAICCLDVIVFEMHRYNFWFFFPSLKCYIKIRKQKYSMQHFIFRNIFNESSVRYKHSKQYWKHRFKLLIFYITVAERWLFLFTWSNYLYTFSYVFFVVSFVLISSPHLISSHYLNVK